MAKKPDLYRAPEDGIVLKYEVSAVPLQDQVGHVRHWGIQVYQNGMVVAMTGISVTAYITGSIPFLSNFSEPRALVVGLAGVTGLLMARKSQYMILLSVTYRCTFIPEGISRRILYPITAIGISGAAMWLSYAHNRRTLSDYCYKTWNDLTKD